MLFTDGLTCGTCFATHLTVNALSCVRVLHLPWNTETQHKRAEHISLELQPMQKLCFTFTYVTGRRLADPVLEFVVFPTFGTYVAICAEFTIGYAGQAGIVTPVRIESPGAVCPTASLVKKTFLSIFIWGGGGGNRGLVNIKPTLFSPRMKMPLAIWNSCQVMAFTKIRTVLKAKINELLIINTEVKPNGSDNYMDEGKMKGLDANCVKVQCIQQITALSHIKKINWLIERRNRWQLPAIIGKKRIHTFEYKRI